MPRYILLRSRLTYLLFWAFNFPQVHSKLIPGQLIEGTSLLQTFKSLQFRKFGNLAAHSLWLSSQPPADPASPSSSISDTLSVNLIAAAQLMTGLKLPWDGWASKAHSFWNRPNCLSRLQCEIQRVCDGREDHELKSEKVVQRNVLFA